MTINNIESFLLFSQDIPSTNLGFVDPRAPVVDVTVRDRDYEIQQSPTLLSSSRAGGTTGAGRFYFSSVVVVVVLLSSSRIILHILYFA